MLIAVFGVIDMIIFFTDPLFTTLAIACLGLSNIFPAIAYAIMLGKPKKEAKERFALWYLLGFGLGCVLYFVFILFAGQFAYAFTAPLISACFLWYFYCCLSSYAQKEEL